jgi:hypothetical protein
MFLDDPEKATEQSIWDIGRRPSLRQDLHMLPKPVGAHNCNPNGRARRLSRPNSLVKIAFFRTMRNSPDVATADCLVCCAVQAIATAYSANSRVGRPNAPAMPSGYQASTGDLIELASHYSHNARSAVFASKSSKGSRASRRISPYLNWIEHQTTNLEVRSSNHFGARHFRTKLGTPAGASSPPIARRSRTVPLYGR